jgi:hypothetical protein
MTQTPPGPRDKVRLRRSPVFTKRPQIIDLEDGELAVNFNAREPGLFIRDLDDEGNRQIRKIGPAHFGDEPPNSQAALYGHNESLSDGELWIDSSQGESLYFLKVWDKDANGGEGSWVVVGEAYSVIDGYLDQFKNGDDGDDYIHTDRAYLKINNKAALHGLSTASGDRLIINDGDEFANGVEVNASALDVYSQGINLVFQTGAPFETDSVASDTFSYSEHGLLDGKKVYVYPELSDETTPSPISSGKYFVINATENSFQLSSNGVTPVSSSGNIYLVPYKEINIGADSNSESITINSNVVWHSGNDGAESGLDADLLDGEQGSHYLNYDNFTNKPFIPSALGDLSNVDDATKVDLSVLVYNESEGKFVANDVNTIITITDGGNF